MHRNIVRSICVAVALMTGVLSSTAGDYGTIFKRWDLGLDLFMIDLKEKTSSSNMKLLSAGYGVTAGINFPVVFSDSSAWSIGINPSVYAAQIQGLSNSLNLAVPVLATFKYNNDAMIDGPRGWHIGATFGAGFTWNKVMPLDNLDMGLTDVIPTLMAEVNFGTRKSSLIKIRILKPLGEMEHEGGTIRYSMLHASIIYTTGF